MQSRTTRLFAVTLIGTSLVSLAQSQETASEKSPELSVLNRYVGSWEETATSKPAVWTPKQTTMTTTTTRRWILNGQMVENTGAWLPGNNELLHLMTYGAERKQYVQWYFDKANLAPKAYRGSWNEGTQTFTFTGSLADGIRTKAQQKFVNKDTFTWTLVAKDREGNVVFDMEGKCVRKK